MSGYQNHEYKKNASEFLEFPKVIRPEGGEELIRVLRWKDTSRNGPPGSFHYPVSSPFFAYRFFLFLMGLWLEG